MKYASPCFTIKQPTKITVEGATRHVELQVSADGKTFHLVSGGIESSVCIEEPPILQGLCFRLVADSEPSIEESPGSLRVTFKE